MSDIWILGATGRVGRAVAAQLAAAQLAPVLVGRDATRLREIAGAIGSDARIVTAGSVDATIAEISRGKPAVVINTIGPFTQTALPIARACPPGAHYVDLSNELTSIIDLLALHDEAVSSSRTFVSGAGFGVLATESVVLKLCAGQPPAETVRVDMMPTVKSEPGRLGEALAASILDGLPEGGRRYANGKLVRAELFGDVETLKLPDGSSVKTAAAPLGELEAAHRASGAPTAVSATSMAPTAPLVRAVLPVAAALLGITPLREFAKRQVANIEMKADTQERTLVSWAHARVRWASGATREGWLRTGDAMRFTTNVTAEVARRLARGEGRPGAYTPGALFGADLAADAGGRFILDQDAA